MRPPRRGEALADALVAIGFVALFLVGLGRPELMDPDESRHAEIARSMLAEDRFLTPRVYGEAYYDKPVGYHWTVAASFALLGPTTTAARLPSALAALATLAVTAWWASRIRDALAARLAATMLATSLLFVGLGRFGGIDMVFTALLTAAIARLSVAASDPDPSPRSALLSYALVALATLVKGPVALALAAPSFVMAWARTGRRSATWLVPWRGAVMVLAIAAPWYAAAAQTDPVYIRTFLETHNLARFVGNEALSHQQSVIYYVVAFPLACLPWTPLLAVGCAARFRSGSWLAAESVLATWLASVLVVFALAGTRLVTYLLPALPALAVLGARGLVDMQREGVVSERALTRLRRWALVWALVVAGAVTGAAFLRIASQPLGARAAATAGILLAATVAYAVALRRYVIAAAAGPAVALLAASSVLAAAGAYGPVADLLTSAKGYRALGAELARDFPPDGVALSLSRAPHALAFYSGRTIGRVRDVDAARAALASDRAVVLLTKSQYSDALARDPRSHLEILWRNAQGTTLLANARAAEQWRRREGVEPSADHDGRHHGFEDRSGHRTRSLSSSRDHSDRAHP